MAPDGQFDVVYTNHPRTAELVAHIQYCLESVSLSFDQWDTPCHQGPSFYGLLIAGIGVTDYVDPMGTNRWPIEVCSNIHDGIDAFYQALMTVATEMDGAVVISLDGTIHEQMVRVNDPSSPGHTDKEPSRVEYADWMGSRHMNALDTSTRDDVVATITLSEETGRVTVFVDGDFTDTPRRDLGGKWRAR